MTMSISKVHLNNRSTSYMYPTISLMRYPFIDHHITTANPSFATIGSDTTTKL